MYMHMYIVYTMYVRMYVSVCTLYECNVSASSY